VPRRALLNEQQGAGWHSLSYWIARPFAQSPAVHSLDSDPTNWWDCMGGGDHGHDHHTTAPSAAPSASPRGSPTTLADLCSDTATACYLVCSQQYINCLADPGTCTTLYAPHPAHCRLLRRRSEGRVRDGAALPITRYWAPRLRSAEYGGDGGGERRDLDNAGLCGPIPASIGTLTNLVDVCVPPPHRLTLQCGSLPTRWVGEQGGERKECSCRGRLAGVSAVRVDVWR
jgi:hypothetical protein